MERIGVVLGSRETTPLEFWVGVKGEGLLRLDDLVVVEAFHPKVGRVRYFGMVDHVAKAREGEAYDTDTFLAVEGRIPVSLVYVAHVSVTRILPEEFLPPDPGSPVYLAQGEELEPALYYEAMRNHKGSTKLPAGLLKNGEAAYLNLEFLNGVKGGHVNISGISGVAAKTSYATFLGEVQKLYPEALGEGAEVGEVLGDVGRVHHHEVGLLLQAEEVDVVHHAPPLVRGHGVLGPAHLEAARIVRRGPLEESEGVLSPDEELPHVAHVKEAGLPPHRQVLLQDGGVLEGEKVPGEVHHPGAQAQVGLVKRGLSHGKAMLPQMLPP